MPLIINDVEIDEATVAHEVETVAAQRREHPEQFDFESPEELTAYARENVICRVLLQQEADKRIESVPAEEVQAAFQELKEQYGGDKEFYEAHDIDESHLGEIKGNLETNLKVQKLMDGLCKDVAPPTGEEIGTYFEENADDFVHPEEIHVSHIVKRPEGESDGEAIFEQMKVLRTALLAGADFADLAGEHSDCSESGGDIGFFSPGQMVEEFETIVFSMADGEISPVFLTQFGYHVALVHERRPERPGLLEDAREDIAEHLLHERKNDRIGEFVEEIKQRSTIVDIPDEPGEAPEAEADPDEPTQDEPPAEDAPADDPPTDEAPDDAPGPQ